MPEPFDFAVIGGGIVGLATARELRRRYPSKTLLLIEKELQVAAHQTGHNSGVLHSGIYYKPGSLKARLCRAGKLAMEAFCEEHGLPYERCGKVIVAVDEAEIGRLKSIYERGIANGVECHWIERDRLRELEPHVAGIAAIHVPESGIVGYRAVAERLLELLRLDPLVDVALGTKVESAQRQGSARLLCTQRGDFSARVVINCGGLHSDRITASSGVVPEVKIVPFRGEYYEVKESRRYLCRNLIYPVPDPAFPFLGVHFTRMIDGKVECGPNAVLAFAREGYRLGSVSLSDLFETLTYRGFHRLAMKHWRQGCGELWRSISKRAFVTALQRLIPEIRSEDLKTAPAGVRAQAVAPDGSMVDDFHFVSRPGLLSVVNAPSPAATASLAIADEIVTQVDRLPRD